MLLLLFSDDGDLDDDDDAADDDCVDDDAATAADDDDGEFNDDVSACLCQDGKRLAWLHPQGQRSKYGGRL
jgi:hypothetical protein